jgi:putative transposase
VGKAYQNEKIDTSRPAVPETVTVALAEIAADVREGLLALAVVACRQGPGSRVTSSRIGADLALVAEPGAGGHRVGAHRLLRPGVRVRFSLRITRWPSPIPTPRRQPAGTSYTTSAGTARAR